MVYCCVGGQKVRQKATEAARSYKDQFNKALSCCAEDPHVYVVFWCPICISHCRRAYDLYSVCPLSKLQLAGRPYVDICSKARWILLSQLSPRVVLTTAALKWHTIVGAETLTCYCFLLLVLLLQACTCKHYSNFVGPYGICSAVDVDMHCAKELFREFHAKVGSS